jgi:putative membrane protein
MKEQKEQKAQEQVSIVDHDHQAEESRHRLISSRITDHLANERTFLAWIRTALAIMAFGFAVERIGLALRELGPNPSYTPASSIHYSTLVGVVLVLLGVIVLIFALTNFLTIRSAIEKKDFHPQANFSIILTVLAGMVGLILAVYLIVGS